MEQIQPLHVNVKVISHPSQDENEKTSPGTFALWWESKNEKNSWVQHSVPPVISEISCVVWLRESAGFLVTVSTETITSSLERRLWSGALLQLWTLPVATRDSCSRRSKPVNSNSACGLSTGISVMSVDTDRSICCSPSQHVWFWVSANTAAVQPPMLQLMWEYVSYGILCIPLSCIHWKDGWMDGWLFSSIQTLCWHSDRFAVTANLSTEPKTSAKTTPGFGFRGLVS